MRVGSLVRDVNNGFVGRIVAVKVLPRNKSLPVGFGLLQQEVIFKVESDDKGVEWINKRYLELYEKE